MHTCTTMVSFATSFVWIPSGVSLCTTTTAKFEGCSTRFMHAGHNVLATTYSSPRDVHTFNAPAPATDGQARAGRGNGQRTTLNDRARAGRSPSLRTWRCKVRARSCVSSVVSGSSGFDAAMPPRVGREASPKRGHASGGKVLRSAQSSRVPRPVQAARRCYSINGRGARSRQRPIVQPGHQVPLQSRGCSNRATKPARCGGSAAQHASCVCVSCLVLRRSTVLVSP